MSANGGRLVIVKLNGGLGNQMFQYAAGRSLSLRTGSSLAVDVRDCDSHCGYELSTVFMVDPPSATPADVRSMLAWRRRRKVQLALARQPFAPLRGRYVPEPHFQHWKGFDNLGPGCYLDGYWQSPDYFASIEPQLRTDFAFRNRLMGLNAEIGAAIAEADASVSVHVRRGDYVADARAAGIHGTADISYYREATAMIAARLEALPTLFVFSDDPAWAKANLGLPSTAIFVEHNKGPHSHFDMQLMALCSHNIIANSSFSWWAAWLNPNRPKVVVAPARWFLVGHDTSTLLPSSWIRI
ncbi:MAG: alpha-1,2-fucosyltransferase [Caldimonas sp.]